jgi:hypothetical protein
MSAGLSVRTGSTWTWRATASTARRAPTGARAKSWAAPTAPRGSPLPSKVRRINMKKKCEIETTASYLFSFFELKFI